MIGFRRDFVKLTTLLRNRGLRHAIGIALLTIRARLMSRADKAWERSIGLKFNKKICLDSL
jgi:hypothetical protein